MSKNKPKQKKGNQQGPSLELVVEQQKRELLQQGFTIKKLQDRVSRMTEENNKIVNNHESMQKNYEQKVDNQRIFIESHESTIQSLNSKIHHLEMIKLQQQSAIKTLQNHLDFQSKNRQKQMEEYKRLASSEMSALENQLKQYNHYMKQRDDVFEERLSLKKTLENQKQVKMRDLADKQREKVQITDKLKDQMLTQIRDMKKKLLSLKSEQLSTTTRLAVLQNHQLTGQLEFQSKQTEKLLFDNQKLKKKAANLQKDVQIHKQVEEQLAKRSHLSRGIIKKLTNKISDLQQQLKVIKQQSETGSKAMNMAQSRNSPYADKSDADKQQQAIQMLKKALQVQQKKFTKLRTELLNIQGQNSQLKIKIRDTQKKSNELSVMLLKYYENVLNGSIDLRVKQDDQYVLDIKGFKKKPVQEWDTEDCKFIVNILLNQLKNNINRYNLGVPTMNKSQILLINDQENQTKLPIIGISDHSLIKKQTRKLRQIQGSIAPKLVGSNIRQWGRTVHSNSVSSLTKKYKS